MSLPGCRELCRAESNGAKMCVYVSMYNVCVCVCVYLIICLSLLSCIYRCVFFDGNSEASECLVSEKEERKTMEKKKKKCGVTCQC